MLGVSEPVQSPAAELGTDSASAGAPHSPSGDPQIGLEDPATAGAALAALSEATDEAVLGPLVEAWRLLSDDRTDDTADRASEQTGRVRTVQLRLEVASLRESGWWNAVRLLLIDSGWGGPLHGCLVDESVVVRRVCARIDGPSVPAAGGSAVWWIAADDPEPLRRCALASAGDAVSVDGPAATAVPRPRGVGRAVEVVPGTWVATGSRSGREGPLQPDETWTCGLPLPSDASGGEGPVLRLRAEPPSATAGTADGPVAAPPACLADFARRAQAIILEVHLTGGLRAAVSAALPSSSDATAAHTCVSESWRLLRRVLRATAGSADAADMERVLGLRPSQLVDAVGVFREDRIVGVRLVLPEASSARLRAWLDPGL